LRQYLCPGLFGAAKGPEEESAAERAKDLTRREALFNEAAEAQKVVPPGSEQAGGGDLPDWSRNLWSWLYQPHLMPGQQGSAWATASPPPAPPPEPFWEVAGPGRL
jgi:hypothetical protein